MTNFEKILFDEAIEHEKKLSDTYYKFYSKLNFNETAKIQFDAVVSIIQKCGLENNYLDYKAKQLNHGQVKDVMENEDNDGEEIIKIVGKNPYDDCDCYAISYYEGKLKDIPEQLHHQEVLDLEWSMKAQKYQICITYLEVLEGE